MEALSVGMYVRHKTLLSSKYVKINKIKEIEEKENCLHIWLEDKDLITEKYLIKASYNIINILEEGDYVNGQEVYYDEELDFLYVQSFDADGEFYQENIAKQSFIDNIKSVITHEQMEQMAYKVEE